MKKILKRALTFAFIWVTFVYSLILLILIPEGFIESLPEVILKLLVGIIFLPMNIAFIFIPNFVWDGLDVLVTKLNLNDDAIPAFFIWWIATTIELAIVLYLVNLIKNFFRSRRFS